MTVLNEDSILLAYAADIAFSGNGGVIGDRLVLGLIGVAVSLAVGPFHLAAVWLGVLGVSSLAEPVFRRVFAGPIESNCYPLTIYVAGDPQDARFVTAGAGSSKSRLWLVDSNSCLDARTSVFAYLTGTRHGAEQTH